MKYLVIAFVFVSSFSAYCSDDQPTPSELRKKSTIQLRQMIEEAYNEIKDTNQKLVNSENQLELTQMSLEQSKANYNDIYSKYTEQMSRANDAEQKVYESEIKSAALKKSNLILKSLAALFGAFLAFVIVSNFMTWASFPLNWIGPILAAFATAAVIFMVF